MGTWEMSHLYSSLIVPSILLGQLWNRPNFLGHPSSQRVGWTAIVYKCSRLHTSSFFKPLTRRNLSNRLRGWAAIYSHVIQIEKTSFRYSRALELNWFFYGEGEESNSSDFSSSALFFSALFAGVSLPFFRLLCLFFPLFRPGLLPHQKIKWDGAHEASGRAKIECPIPPSTLQAT
jgi:hypothetical protein